MPKINQKTLHLLQAQSHPPWSACPVACMRLPPGDTVVADRDSDALRGEHIPERTEE